jgi:putative nucleotidyltransferase with HDIG domain
MSIAFDQVIKRIQDLPSLPAVVIELLSSMDQEDIDVHSLAVKITLDQALTAKTLRLANSSFYGMSSKVTTIAQAVSVLGFNSIRTIVTACSLTGAFQDSGSGSFNFQGFWRHSVATAVCAKLLARQLRVNPDTAFTAGLLHDIGSLVLATRFPQQYEDMLAYQRANDCYLIDAERALFELDHAIVGSTLAGHWKFPSAIQQAVAAHHDAAPASLALAIHFGNTLAHALDLSDIEDDLAPPVSLASWSALGLSSDASGVLFRTAEDTFHEMCQILVT